MHTDELVPVAAGLFEGTGSAARLIGTRCTSCGTHYFPKTLSCRVWTKHWRHWPPPLLADEKVF
jgi:hypothetical protein